MPITTQAHKKLNHQCDKTQHNNEKAQTQNATKDTKLKLPLDNVFELTFSIILYQP